MQSAASRRQQACGGVRLAESTALRARHARGPFCGEKRAGYARLAASCSEFVRAWKMEVFFELAMRPIDCPACGVTVERVPRATCKQHLMTKYRSFLAGWVKRLSWRDSAVAFNTTCHNAIRSVTYAVQRGVANRYPGDCHSIRAIGVGRIQLRSGYAYSPLVYQITGPKRVLWVSRERTEQSLRRFCELLTYDVRPGIQFVCSDMCSPCLSVIVEQIPRDLHILDRLRIMRNMNVAIDQVLRQKVARLRCDGYEPTLTTSCWCLLKRPEHLTDNKPNSAHIDPTILPRRHIPIAAKVLRPELPELFNLRSCSHSQGCLPKVLG
jgi:transposase